MTRFTRSFIAITGLVALAGACSQAEPSDPLDSATTALVATQGTETTTTLPLQPAVPDDPVTATMDAVTAALLRHDPELVTDLGAGSIVGAERHDRLKDASVSGLAAETATARGGLQELDAIDQASLTPGTRLSVTVLRDHLEDVVARGKYPLHDYPVSFITGAPANFIEFMTDVHPITNENDVEDYGLRLIAFGTQIEQIISGIEARAEAGMIPPQRSLDIARFQINAAVGRGDPASHPLVTDLAARLAPLEQIDAAAANGHLAKAEAAVGGIVIPAYERLDKVIRNLDGRAGVDSGVWAVADGDAYYETMLRHHLSLDVTADEVHSRGLDEVNRVRSELASALTEMGYPADTSFVAAIQAARREAGSYPTGSEPERAEVLSRAVELSNAAALALSDQFGLRPTADLVVARPREGREGGSGAYYRAPPIDGSRPGTYYLSMGGPTFPLLTFSTTTYHEGVPGHHFQLSIQRTLAQLPLHQRAITHSGFAEGWALYAERLAAEAGLYDDDPWGNIGRLQMELLRATRMVVDTGIHHHRWSRQEAIEYMVDLAFIEDQAEAEVDRYIVWPGQAPAYMMGMLAILEAREAAVEILGDRFDPTGFHDAILSVGSVPLELLDDVVRDWVAGL